ncbi:MAG: acyltransferase [Acidobacteria bacterium]|nr:acyltransferase [Acidobacteriota bacterium]
MRSQKPESGRLLSVDILRGVASLIVVLYHLYDGGIFFRPPYNERPLTKFALMLPVSYGFVGVYLFFVISGFCIHLRAAKAKSVGREDFQVGFIPFWKKRIRRLYPAYLASIALYLLVLGFQGKLLWSWFFAWDLGSHLLMIHNFDPRTLYGISVVFWTLAIEEQLYLAYFGILWMRRRFSWGKVLLCCLGARFLWFAFAWLGQRFLGIEIVFLGAAAATWCIWVLGAVTVEAYLGLIKLPRWTRSWTLFCGVCGLAMFLTYIDFFASTERSLLGTTVWGQLVLQPLWGIAAFLLVNVVIAKEKVWFGKREWVFVVQLLAGVGLFSYSLYLTHEAVIRVANNMQFPKLLTLMLCVGLAYVFFRVFEKPFLNSPQPEPRRGMVVEQTAS